MLLSIDKAGSAGVQITDSIERRQCQVQTPSEVSPEEVNTDNFYFPVDQGVEFESTNLEIPYSAPILVRNHAGFMIDEISNGETNSFPEDLYSIEVCAPIKLYVVVESSFSIEVAGNESTISFPESVAVKIGARSHHKQPAGNINVTEDPQDVMTAVSYLGSALKTTTCERSYPTLRGHPPTLSLGDELSIPEQLSRPDTGIWIEVPAELEAIYAASSLAYYLGADLRPGSDPRIVTEDGFEYSLDNHEVPFEEETERVLKQVFFLDCLTRTEGYYQVNLHERNELQEEVSLDFTRLYDESIADQLAEYLSVPYDVVSPHFPTWKLVAHVVPEAENIEVIPFLVNDLAVIRPPNKQQSSTPMQPDSPPKPSVADGGFVRGSASRAVSDSADSTAGIHVEDADALEQAWLGPDFPLDASKVIPSGYYNQLERSTTDGQIEITVVCNDTAMGAERDVVDEVYGSREELPFSVSIHRELTTRELESVLEEEIDFLHYIGHIEQDGFECVDGSFDASTLSSVGVDVFFLNACTSYQQGIELIESGAIAGVATVQEVINSEAERVGKTLARLLNLGFPLQSALNLAKSQSLMGGNYVVLGDGGVDIVQCDSGVPMLYDITEMESGYELSVKTYLTRKRGLGRVTIPYVGDNSEYYIASGLTGEFQVEGNELGEDGFVFDVPAIIDEEIKWPDLRS